MTTKRIPKIEEYRNVELFFLQNYMVEAISRNAQPSTEKKF